MLQLWDRLTLNNPELVGKLLAQFHPASLRDLSKVESASLIKIITDGKIQVPAQIAATTTPETITQYAEAHSGIALRESDSRQTLWRRLWVRRRMLGIKR